jgi:hypothetical protein
VTILTSQPPRREAAQPAKQYFHPLIEAASAAETEDYHAHLQVARTLFAEDWIADFTEGDLEAFDKAAKQFQNNLTTAAAWNLPTKGPSLRPRDLHRQEVWSLVQELRGSHPVLGSASLRSRVLATRRLINCTWPSNAEHRHTCIQNAVKVYGTPDGTPVDKKLRANLARDLQVISHRHSTWTRLRDAKKQAAQTRLDAKHKALSEKEVYKLLRGGPGSTDLRLTSVFDPRSKQVISELPLVIEKLTETFVDHFKAAEEENTDGVDVNWNDEGDNSPHIPDHVYEPDVKAQRTGLIDKISPEELAKHIMSLPNDSAPGPDALTYGLLKDLVKEHARRQRAEKSGEENPEEPPILFDCMLALLNGCISRSYTPICLKGSVLIPLVKKRALGRSLTNLRPIVLQCSLLKVLQGVLADRLVKSLHDGDVLCGAQHGFLIGRNSAAAIDIFKDTVEDAQNRKRQLFACLYDLVAAYDRVRADRLSRAMRRLNIPAAFCELVMTWLRGQHTRVLLNQCLGKPIDICRGLPQGGPASPILFVIFLDPLLQALVDSGIGYELQRSLVADEQRCMVSAAAFADDLLTMAASADDILGLHDIVLTWCEAEGMQLSPKTILSSAQPLHEAQVPCLPLTNATNSAPVTYYRLTNHSNTWV